MAEFQWWLLLVGLVAGGGLVAVVTMDGRRREVDLEDLERRAEANWIAERLVGSAQWIDGPTVSAVLDLHREYLGLPPPDAFVGDEAPGDAAFRDHDADVDPDDDPDVAPKTDRALDRDPDRATDDIRDSGGRRPDGDLSQAGEQQAPAGQEAHAGADREQRRDR